MDDRIDQWWGLFAVALFLLFPVDLFMTLLAVARHGIGVEVNPIMRWLLSHGLVAVTAANLVAVTLVVVLFDAVIEIVQNTPLPQRDRFVHGITVWIGFVVAASVVLTANHLLVLV